MLQRISSYIADGLIQADKIDHSEKEIYQYGLESLLLMVLNLSTAVAISAVMGKLWECLFFHLVFIPLRVNAGGYHARNALRCYLLSASMLILVLSVLPYITKDRIHFVLFGMLCSGILIAMLAPVGSPNKPLDAAEKAVYGHRTRLILLVEAIAGILFYWHWNYTAFGIIFLAFLVLALSLAAGMIHSNIQL